MSESEPPVKKKSRDVTTRWNEGKRDGLLCCDFCNTVYTKMNGHGCKIANFLTPDQAEAKTCTRKFYVSSLYKKAIGEDAMAQGADDALKEKQ